MIQPKGYAHTIITYVLVQRMSDINLPFGLFSALSENLLRVIAHNPMGLL